MPNLTQLIYMSAAAQPFTAADLTALLLKARAKNESLGVSGMLVYHEGSFLQILEGDDATVESLYSRIATDPRHTNCSRLLKSTIEERSFADWTMGFVNTKAKELQSLPGFTDFFGSGFSQTAFAADPSKSHKLLLAFREGKWHQKVEH